MWYFLAKYTDMITEEEISRKIEFDGENMFWDEENPAEKCYMYAMSQALKLRKPNESLDTLEFEAC